jgi:hypothetical protein
MQKKSLINAIRLYKNVQSIEATDNAFASYFSSSGTESCNFLKVKDFRMHNFANVKY